MFPMLSINYILDSINKSSDKRSEGTQREVTVIVRADLMSAQFLNPTVCQTLPGPS